MTKNAVVTENFRADVIDANSARIWCRDSLAGFVRKLPDTDTERFPVQIFAPKFVPGKHAEFGQHEGSFFGPDAWFNAVMTLVEGRVG